MKNFKWLIMANAIIALTVIFSANVSANTVDVSDAYELAAALADDTVTIINLIDNIEVAGDVPAPIFGATKTISSAGNFDLTLGGALTIPVATKVTINLNDFIVNHSTGNSVLTVEGELINGGTITANTSFNITGAGGTFNNNGIINMNSAFTIGSTITNAATGTININGDSGLARSITTPINNAGNVYVTTTGTISTTGGGPYVTNTGLGAKITVDTASNSTTVTSFSEFLAATKFVPAITNITINNNITVEGSNITVPAGTTVTIPSPYILTNRAADGGSEDFDNYGTIIGTIENHGHLDNHHYIIGEVLGPRSLLNATTADPGIVITNGEVIADSNEQLKLALATPMVKKITIKYYGGVSSLSPDIVFRDDVTVIIPNEPGIFSSPSALPVDFEVESGYVLENRGTIDVQSPNGLRINLASAVYNAGTITTTDLGSIVNGIVYSGNTVNPVFNIADGPIEFSEYKGETYFAIGVNNRLFTRYTGTATLTGTSTDDTNIVTVDSGTHNINMNGLTITAPTTTPFLVREGAVNLNLIGLNTLTSDEFAMEVYGTDTKINITSTTGGRLIATGTNPDSSSGINGGSILINGNADVTASGNGNGAGIRSENINIGGTARVTAVNIHSGPGVTAMAFSSKPILSLADWHFATVRAGTAAPGVVVESSTYYHQNSYAQVQITYQPPAVAVPVAAAAVAVPTSPNTGAYTN